MSSDAPPPLGPADGLLDGVNATFNATAAAAPPSSGPLGLLLQHLDFFMLELKLVSGAMGIIYLGAHAALRRPPSAAPARPAKSRGRRADEDRFSQGLELSDAIVFPLVAGAMLVSLYYLIHWLKDPAMLNKVLRWYMATMSIASMLTLYAHAMELATSLAFPRYWRGRDGAVRAVVQRSRTVALCDAAGNVVDARGGASSPLPGPLALLACSTRAKAAAWALRELLTRRWVLRVLVHGLVPEQTARIKFAHIMSLLLALATALVYFSTSSPALSNVLGYGMCYTSFLVLSPTDFMIGSLVLVGLFFYDIYMVFFTPFMVTVATKLDVPIKLSFEAGARKSILGLGDIVIPGMLIGWALRLDLWLFYLRRVKYEATELELVERDEASGELVTRSETRHVQVKARYAEAKAWWGEKLWTRGPLFLWRRRQLPADLAAAEFPKTYFYASMAGYALGMAATLAMLVVHERGQPALLYLVPGVLGALTATALARGEMGDVWAYTEDGSLDTADVVVELDEAGRARRQLGRLENGVVDTTKGIDARRDARDAQEHAHDGQDTRDAQGAARGHCVFLLSLDAPDGGGDDDDGDGE